MKEIKYINSKGAEIVFTSNAPFILQHFETDTALDIHSVKGVQQDGETYLSSALDKNALILTVAVKGETPQDFIKLKRTLIQALNPKLEQGTLVYSDEVKELKIKCVPSKIPFVEEKSRLDGVAIIPLTAHDPKWGELLETRDELAVWVPDFGFELELIAGGIEFGHRELSLIKNIINDGDVETGFTIEFTAIANVVNPAVYHIGSGEFIQIEKTMVAGEKITITTNFGNKRITSDIGGVITNAINYLGYGSTFLQLEVGDNLIRYDATSGLGNLDVTTYHSDKFLGV